jgi:hypothetical protein
MIRVAVFRFLLFGPWAFCVQVDKFMQVESMRFLDWFFHIKSPAEIEQIAGSSYYIFIFL